MSAIDDIVAQLPLDQLATELGATPDEVAEAAEAALPALLGGLEANARDEAGAASIASALDQHSPELIEAGVDLGQVDTADGARITQHIFGGNQEQVVQQLGGVQGGSELIKKLLPILAPIVLSYLAKQVGGRGAGAGGGLIGTVLQEILKGASQGTTKRGTSAGSIIGDLLGGLLGGGRR